MIRTKALLKELRNSKEFDEIVGLNLSSASEAYGGFSSIAKRVGQTARRIAPPMELAMQMVADKTGMKKVGKWMHEARPDLIIAETIPVGYLCVKSKPKRSAVVVDVHGLTLEQRLRQSRNWSLSARYWKRVQSVALHDSDHVVVVSENMKSYLQEEFGLSNLTVVQNGGYLQSFRARYAQPLRFLFSGIVEYWESPTTLVELSRRLAPKACTVFGTGSLLESILISGSRLEYGGVLGHEEALQVSTQYQVGLLPSSSDITRVVASPIKLFDYWSVGLPVIAAQVGSWADPVARFDAGWLVPPEQFVDTVEAVSSVSEETWIRKAENGVRLIRERFNWPKIVRESLIPSLMSSAG